MLTTPAAAIRTIVPVLHVFAGAGVGTGVAGVGTRVAGAIVTGAAVAFDIVTGAGVASPVTGAIVTGATVTGATGAAVVGAVVGPIGEQPQGAAKVERAGQKSGSMKPLKPARSKLRHDMGGSSGMVRITSGSVISSPAPHTEHSGKPGDGGIGEAIGAGATVMTSC